MVTFWGAGDEKIEVEGGSCFFNKRIKAYEIFSFANCLMRGKKLILLLLEWHFLLAQWLIRK